MNKKQSIKLNESQFNALINKLVKESINNVIKEGFEENSTLEDLIMKLYNLGADLNINKDNKNISIAGIGSVIMSTAQRMMEIVKNRPMNNEFSDSFNKNVQKFKK